jgi:hypothetical protein
MSDGKKSNNKSITDQAQVLLGLCIVLGTKVSV